MTIDVLPPSGATTFSDSTGLEYVDHGSQALGRLLEIFKGKPYMEALVSSYMEKVQEVENTLWALKLLTVLSTATGDALDRIGLLVGEPLRGGSDDAAYKLRILARIVINVSNGKREDLLAVVYLLIGEEAVIYVDEHYPASILYTIPGPYPAGITPSILVGLLRAAKGAGVKLGLSYSDEYSEGELFEVGPVSTEPFTDFGADGTFTRASAATWWDGTTLYRFASGELRTVYRNGYRGYVLEELRKNQLYHSSDLTQGSVWSVTGTATRTYGQADPSGGNGATRLTFDESNSWFAQDLNASQIPDNTVFTSSFFARSISGQQTIRHIITKRDGTFQVTDVTLTSQWKRFTVTSNLLAGATQAKFQFSNQGGTPLTKTVDVFGCQAELGGYATSLIENTVSLLTRQADVLFAPIEAGEMNWDWVGYFEPFAAMGERSGETHLWAQPYVAPFQRVALLSGSSNISATLNNSLVSGEPLIPNFNYVKNEIQSFYVDAPGGNLSIASLTYGSFFDSGTGWEYPVDDEYLPLQTSGPNATSGWVSDLYRDGGRAEEDVDLGLGSLTDPLTDFGSNLARTTPATYWDGSVLYRYASGEPRVVYMNGVRGYIVEEARTNYILACSAMNTGWVPQGGVVRTYNQSDPSGGTIATQVYYSAQEGIYQDISGLADNTLYKISFWAKYTTGNGNLRVYFTAKDGTTVFQDFVLTTGWVRYEFTSTVDSKSGGTTPRINLYNPDLGTTKTHHYFGIQLEKGAYKTSLIETTTAAATRNADSFTIPSFLGEDLSQPLKFWWQSEIGQSAREGYYLFMRMIGTVTRDIRLGPSNPDNLTMFASDGSPGTFIPSFQYNVGDLVKVSFDLTVSKIRAEGQTGSSSPAEDTGTVLTPEDCSLTLTDANANAYQGWISDLYVDTGIDPNVNATQSDTDPGGRLAGVI